MAITNYGDLKKAVIAYADRTDLTDIIPTTITLAEKRIFRELRSPSNEQKVFFDALETTYHVDTPAALLEVKNIKLMEIPPHILNPLITPPINPQPQEGRTLNFVPVSLFNSSDSDNLTWTRDLNNIWVKGGIPKGNRLIITYWADLSGMNDDTETNEVLLKHFDVYLFGALAELQPYLVDDERAGIWEAKYRQAMNDAMSYLVKLDYKSSPTLMRFPTEYSS